MNETREQIVESLLSEDKDACFFLMSLDYDEFFRLVDKATERRSEENAKKAEQFFDFFGSEAEESEEPFEDMIQHLAYQIRNTGTEIWFRRLGKEAAQSLINGLQAANYSKVKLENGDEFDAFKIANQWEELHEETLYVSSPY